VTEKKEPSIALPPVDHIGFVVEDVDRAVDYYSSVFGWGPFETVESAEMKGVNYRGRKADCRLKSATGKSGSVGIELIQVLEGETPHREFLKEDRQGLHHLAFRVDNLDAILVRLAEDGIEPIWNKDFGVISFAYLDSDKTGGVIFELIEYRNPGGKEGRAPEK
jgi:methylmalonyl-CoA/ethylmalonyl-CoA epimerase